MDTRKIPLLTLILIVCLATVLRFYKVATVPPGLNSDEVAIGYNAYSILRTGRDEYGQFFPLAFRSFDDYKPPLYVYMVVPAIALFGLNAFAVRFPSILLGVLAVISTYFLVRELFPDEKSAKLPLLSAFLLAILPWHLQFTRTAYETGSTAFFTATGLLFLFKGLRGKKPFLIPATLLLGLETYLYQAAKAFVPLIVVAFLFFYWPVVKKKIALLILFLLGFGLVFLPIAYYSTTAAGQLRLKGLSILQDPLPHDLNISWSITDWKNRDRISALIFHPAKLEYSWKVIKGYFVHFRPDFLFLGDNGPIINHAPNVGLLYLWMLPFLVLGFYYLFNGRERRTAWFLTFWVLLAPLPAAITWGTPSAVRTAIILPSLPVIVAVGIFGIKKFAWPLVLIFLAIFSYFFVYYLHMYFIHLPIDYSKQWYYGYPEVVREVQKIQGNYNQIIVSTTLDQPLNFFQFYLPYDPATYLTVDGGRVSGGFAEERNHFSQYFFRSLSWDKDHLSPKTLFVGDPKIDFPKYAKIIKTFYYLDGQPSILLVEADKQ